MSKKIISERERRLQRKLIPVNIIVCIISLVAAVSLFLFPILKIDVGGMVRDSGITGLVEEKIDEVVDKQLEETDNGDINYKPVVSVLIKDIMGSVRGEVSVSALSAFKVLTGSGNKTKIVMDELLLGEDALATKLVNSVTEAVANVFRTRAGRDLLEEAVVLTLTKAIITSVDGETVAGVLNDKNVKELTAILRGMEDVENGDVTEVAARFIGKIDSILGESAGIDADNKQEIADKIQSLYDDTADRLGADGDVTMEAITCVTLSESIDLNEINIQKLFDKLLNGNKSEGGANINTVDEETGGGETEPPTEGEEPPTGGGSGSERPIVTSYDGFLKAIGFDDDGREEFKENLRALLNEKLDGVIEEKGVDDYMGYYQYVFLVILAFTVPWLILFLFSFFRLFAKNKRFTMWYVKLICWIPAFLWVALKLVPLLATKFAPDMWNSETGTIVKGALSAVSTYTWIDGLCYVLLWLVSIFWAFPIKHKIRKERKNPEVVDAEDDYDGYVDFES